MNIRLGVIVTDDGNFESVSPLYVVHMVVMNFHRNSYMVLVLCTKTIKQSNSFIILFPVLRIVGKIVCETKTKGDMSPMAVAKH